MSTLHPGHPELPSPTTVAAMPVDQRLRGLAVTALAALALGGCGLTGSGDSSPDAEASLLLGQPPGGVHAGVFLAVERDFASAGGVDLDVRPPVRTGAAALEQLQAGRTDAAVVSIHDLARAVAAGDEVVGVLALVQRPLTALVGAPGVARPRDAEGRTVRVEDRVDRALLRAMVRQDGGDPDRVRTTAAAGSAGSVALLTDGPFDDGREVLRLDRYGAPAFPELVLVVTRTTLDERRGLVRAIVAAVQRGTRETIVDPEASVTAIQEAEPDLDRARLTAQLDAALPLFQASDGTIGTFDVDALRTWARYEQRVGIVRRPVDVFRAFSPTEARESARQTSRTSGE